MIKIFENGTDVSRAAADYFVEIAQQAIDEKGRFTVALSGGNSPRKCYELLASKEYKKKVDWDKVYIFWGDERFVPRDDDQNNAKMAFDSLLDHVPIPDDHIFPIPYSGTPRESANEYEKTLRNYFRDKEPVFDLIYLGLGENGHTASLFPNTNVLNKMNIWVSEVYLEDQNMYRITLTLPVINQAENIIFIVYGQKKAEIFSNVLIGPHQPKKWPAQLIKPSNGKLIWMIDQAAASVYVNKKNDLK